MANKKNEKGKQMSPIKDDRNFRDMCLWLEEPLNFSDDYIDEYIRLNGKKNLSSKEVERKEFLELEIGKIHGVENGFWVGNLDYKEYFRSLTTIRSNIIKEYDCRTTVECMLVDRIVACYWRAMKCDRIYNKIVLVDGGSYSQLKVNLTKELNKTIDISNRQLNANIVLLKELKQPKLNIKVNAKTAFVGQNQQFNTKQNETIEPK